MKTAAHAPWWSAVVLSGAFLVHAADPQPGIALDNVVIVLDASGSMDSRMPRSTVIKMDAAKEALKQVVRQLPPTIQVGLLVFSGQGLTNVWVYPLGPRDDALLLEAIDRPQPAGGTPLGASIKQAADRLLEERQRQFGYGTFRLLVVTDGEAQDRNLVDRYTPEIIARGITVDVIGVAMSQQHTLATRVHSYRPANDPESLQRALSEVFGEIAAARDDSTQAEGFAILAPIPAEVASAALQALATSGNQPIGEAPARTDERAAPGPPSRGPTAALPGPATSEPSGSNVGLPLVWGVLGTLLCLGSIALVFFVVILRAFNKRRSR